MTLQIENVSTQESDVIETSETNTIKSFPEIFNQRFAVANNKSVTPEQRWQMVRESLSPVEQQILDRGIQAAVEEFRMNHPKIKSWKQLEKLIPQAKSIRMNKARIVISLQRDTKPDWIKDILNGFIPYMLDCIKVYQPKGTNVYVVYDGQHTLIVLWLILTEVFGEEVTDDIMIPVMINRSQNPAEVRDNFVRHNSMEAKLVLSDADLMGQMVQGVRFDGSDNPKWIEAELKQRHLERFNFCVVDPKSFDSNKPRTISRLTEIKRMNPVAVGWLLEYLSLSTPLNGHVVEKEVVMMGKFFECCYMERSRIRVNSRYIQNLYNTCNRLFKNDFRPGGEFWEKAEQAYLNWHAIKIGIHTGITAKFSSEPVHGYPFLIAQLRKSFQNETPTTGMSSAFYPEQEDLF